MRKGIIRTLLMTLAFVILSLPGRANAGTDMGTLSKDDPCVHIKFSLSAENDFYGGFFAVNGDAKKNHICIEKLTDDDAPIQVDFANVSNGSFDIIGSYTFTKGSTSISEKLPDFKDGEMYFIQIENPDLAGFGVLDLDISVYSEGLGGKAYSYAEEKLIASKISLSEKTVILFEKGETAKLGVTLDKSLKKKGVKWTSSNKKVATVNKKGKITAKGYGSAIITCTSKKNKKYSVKCAVTVAEPSIEMVLGYDLQVGDAGTMKPVITPAGAEVNWSSSNEDVIKINKDGSYTAVAPGEASITCSLARNKKIKAICYITVMSEAEYAVISSDIDLLQTLKTILKGTGDPLYQYLNGMSAYSKVDDSGHTIWSVSYQNNGTISSISAYEDTGYKSYKTAFIRQYPVVTGTGGVYSSIRDELLKGTYDYAKDSYGVVMGWSMFDSSTSKEDLETMIGSELTDELYEKLKQKYTSYNNVIIYGKNAEGVLSGRYAGFVNYSSSSTSASYSIYGVAEDNPDRYGALFSGTVTY